MATATVLPPTDLEDEPWFDESTEWLELSTHSILDPFSEARQPVARRARLWWWWLRSTQREAWYRLTLAWCVLRHGGPPLSW